MICGFFLMQNTHIDPIKNELDHFPYLNVFYRGSICQDAIIWAWKIPKFWPLKKTPEGAAVKTVFFPALNVPQEQKWTWEPPVLWNFLFKALFLGHIEPILSQKLVKFISEKTKKTQKQPKLMFLLCFKVNILLKHLKTV